MMNGTLAPGDYMSDTKTLAGMERADVARWAEQPFEVLFAISKPEVEEAQREALIRRFQAMRPEIAALDKLASRQGVDHIGSIEDAVPVFFDHRVYKSYPLSLLEKRQYDRLTAWMRRLTVHDITKLPLDDVRSVDAWLDRLDDYGMIVGHSTGTTGKLSFIPRSQTEWPAWRAAYFEMRRAATGVDTLRISIPSFQPGYRYGHHMQTKMQALFARESAEGEEGRHVLYDYALSSDLLSLAGRLQAAEERGELDKLDIDPKLLEERAELIERSRHRNEDLQRWFAKLAEEYRGQRVRISGTASDLVQLAQLGRAQGVVCEFTPDSILLTSGGLKALKDSPADWEQVAKDFFGINRISSMYGMSECMGLAPQCDEGYYHFFPYTIPVMIDEDGTVLPREGVHTGRLGLFDLLAESYWGGFMSGDRVTMNWDYACECGWKGPRIDRNVARFADLEGGDDKITCAGTAQAYSDFMDYVSSG
jgi:hypothetical protein